MADYYKLLGINRDANNEDIRQAYRRLARKYHPDRFSAGLHADGASEEKKKAEQEWAAGMFASIVEACDVLSDPIKRILYDNVGYQAVHENLHMKFNTPAEALEYIQQRELPQTSARNNVDENCVSDYIPGFMTPSSSAGSPVPYENEGSKYHYNGLPMPESESSFHAHSGALALMSPRRRGGIGSRGMDGGDGDTGGFGLGEILRMRGGVLTEVAVRGDEDSNNTISRIQMPTFIASECIQTELAPGVRVSLGFMSMSMSAEEAEKDGVDVPVISDVADVQINSEKKKKKNPMIMIRTVRRLCGRFRKRFKLEKKKNPNTDTSASAVQVEKGNEGRLSRLRENGLKELLTMAKDAGLRIPVPKPYATLGLKIRDSTWTELWLHPNSNPLSGIVTVRATQTLPMLGPVAEARLTLTGDAFEMKPVGAALVVHRVSQSQYSKNTTQYAAVVLGQPPARSTGEFNLESGVTLHMSRRVESLGNASVGVTCRFDPLAKDWSLSVGMGQRMSRLMRSSMFSTDVQVSNDGVSLVANYRHGHHHIRIPIQLSPSIKPWPVMLASLASTLLSTGVRYGVIYPLASWRKRRRLRAVREASREFILKQATQAKASVEMMQIAVARKTAFEKSRDGLIILTARYGVLDAAPSREQHPDFEPWIDVVVPVQHTVVNSQLHLPPGPKSTLDGFFDPAPGEKKELYIVYLFRGEVHHVLIPEFEAVAAPLRKHKRVVS